MTVVFIVVALGAFITGLSKGGLGGALGALVTPLFALVMPAPIAVGLTLPLLISGDLCALYAHWGGWDKKILLKIMPGTIAGVIIGSIVLGKLSSVTLQHGLGLVALLYTAWKLYERKFRDPIDPKPESWHAHFYGAGTGFASTLANAGGPIFTIFLLSERITPSVFVGTSALYYAILNSSKIPGYLINGILRPDTIGVVAWAIPLIPFGVWSGILLDRYMDMKTFETVILVLLAVTGVLLLR